MRAKHATACGICQTTIHPGEEIAVLLKKWVHTDCKKDEVARRTEAVRVLQGVTEIPPEYSPVTQYDAGTERRRRRTTRRSGPTG